MMDRQDSSADQLAPSEVQHHYETLLAPIYEWMAGGADAAMGAGAADLQEFLAARPGLAIDLGAGFGAHAIPLARAGWRVVAIDSSALLLEELRSAAQGLRITACVDDLLNLEDHVAAHAADLVLCMGDTLTHLPDEAAVARLARSVASALAPGGRFAATFRDYTSLPARDSRFIHVRSDAGRIHTCFLEEAGARVRVHDVVHERLGGRWSMKVSSYHKVRLSPDGVAHCFRSVGLAADLSSGPRGMVRVTARC
jgi:SAM-dependent methyltransferase